MAVRLGYTSHLGARRISYAHSCPAQERTRGAARRGQDPGVFNMRQTSLTSPFSWRYLFQTIIRVRTLLLSLSLSLSLSVFSLRGYLVCAYSRRIYNNRAAERAVPFVAHDHAVTARRAPASCTGRIIDREREREREMEARCVRR
jgi:hypothetical protein